MKTKTLYNISAVVLATATLLMPPIFSSAQIISGGLYHSVFICSDNTVSACGYNSNGQLGNGTNTNSTLPVQVSSLTGIIAISAGWEYSIALKNDGTVWAWGFNTDGELGNGTNTNSNIPVQVSNLSGVIAISAGAYHSLALKNDGTVWAWGWNGQGQLGNETIGTGGSRNIPVQVSNLSGVIAIATGGAYASLALKNDGNVWAWGYNGFGQLGNGTNTDSNIPLQVSLLTNIIAITGGYQHSIALRDDGTVWAWGYNGSGQLGNGTSTTSNIPVQVSNLSNVNAISGGNVHSIALKNDGTVWTWGDNSLGQLGIGNNTLSNVPLQVINVSGMIAIAGGNTHSIALKNDGMVWTWGGNAFGQLANGTLTSINVPAQSSGLCQMGNVFYSDSDGDSYGNPNVSIVAITQPVGYVSNNADCNDADAAINPNTVWYLDADNDNYYTSSGVIQCTSPGAGYRISGLLLGGDDCNDNNPDIYPGALEECNGVDDDCDGITDEGFDNDGDGYTICGSGRGIGNPYGTPVASFVDCNDNNVAIHPGATEVCNGIDDDCDGQTDEGCNTTAPNTLVIENGVTLKTSGAVEVVLDNANLIFDGILPQSPGEGTFKFTGTDNNFISGTALPLIDILEIAKTGAAELQLQSNMSVGSFINFTSGLINLNANNILLLPGALLNGESEASHITGDNGGFVEITQTLNTPSSANPGNLGAIFTSSQNPGSTIIRRGHMVQSIGSQLSIKRYFNISPANNLSLNATLRFTYFDAEMNSLDENSVVLWKSPDNINWSEQGFDSRNTTTNYAEKTGIADFSQWTLANSECEIMQVFYADADGDGYGNPNQSQQACSAPVGYVTDNTDCDDADAAIHAPVTYYVDADGDGFGSATSAQFCQLTPPAGYTNNNTDCDDANVLVHPGGIEICNNIDDDCDGSIDEGVQNTFYRDADGDSYGNAGVTTQACTAPAGYVNNSTDCDDASASVHPDATELCNGVDDDCDGATDEGVTNTYYRDADGDGYGNAAVTTQACTAPAGYVNNSTDCDDASASVHPGATELCNGIDDNCNGNTDEGVTNTYYRDGDGDSYGNAAVTTQACTAPAGYVNNSTDCDDASASVHPDATELCNGVDDDCDGATDEGVTNTYYRDADGDGYGNAAVTTQACTAPAGYVNNSTDCDDASASVHPGATELCNGVDDNCDGNTDEGVTNIYYRDADGDSYGNAAVTTQACTAPAGYVNNSTDCNDTNASVHPGATELCNGIDDDCNGSTDEGCPPSITIHDVTVLETVGNALVPVTLSAAYTQNVTVNYKTVNGTARSRKDYTAVSGTLTFTPGEISKNISVPILVEAANEPDEYFTVTITLPKKNPVGTIADGSATVTITESALPLSVKQQPLFEDSKAEVSKIVVPNPQRKHEQLRFYGIESGRFDVLMTDVNGKVVVKQKNYRNNWSMSRLAPGIYFYQVVYRNQKGEQQIKTGKLIIID